MLNNIKDYLDMLGQKGSVPGLDNMYALLEAMGNPQAALRIVHISGTNGKGSTSAFLTSILMAAGYKVGVYTSPVVFDYYEKIRINNKNITEQEFVELALSIKKCNELIKKDKQLEATLFEFETAMALQYFKDQKCDIALIETGMGGTLDATNVFERVLCSIITSVSMDHEQFLGNTLEKIATNKAGIIKPGSYAVTAYTNEAVARVFEKRCEEVDSRLIVTNRPEVKKTELGATVFDYISNTLKKEYSELTIGLIGAYQPENAANAIECAEVLSIQGYRILEEHIYEGLKKACWPGRFEIIKREPLTIIDGAHNPDAAIKLRKSLKQYLPGYKHIYIMGVFADKDYKTIIDMMIPLGEVTYTVTTNNPRALDGKALCKEIELMGGKAQACATIEEAVYKSNAIYKQLKETNEKVAIIAFGSLSYLKEVIACK